ncbi:MAG: hypothetical protein IPJ52_12635 [Rhodocyclaceae bacterium]|nr:hypothetical protein [Rhodocyclaceae bacterium]
MADVLGGDADMEQLFIDSTIVRAHQHSVAPKKAGSREIGRSRGGPTKLHVPSTHWAKPTARHPSAGQIAVHRLCPSTDQKICESGRGGRQRATIPTIP